MFEIPLPNRPRFYHLSHHPVVTPLVSPPSPCRGLGRSEVFGIRILFGVSARGADLACPRARPVPMASPCGWFGAVVTLVAGCLLILAYARCPLRSVRRAGRSLVVGAWCLLVSVVLALACRHFSFIAPRWAYFCSYRLRVRCTVPDVPAAVSYSTGVANYFYGVAGIFSNACVAYVSFALDDCVVCAFTLLVCAAPSDVFPSVSCGADTASRVSCSAFAIVRSDVASPVSLRANHCEGTLALALPATACLWTLASLLLAWLVVSTALASSSRGLLRRRVPGHRRPLYAHNLRTSPARSVL